MTATETKEFILPFVGREEELQFLLDEYDQMLHAQYRSVWIEAPAGMGKTTLVEEFLKRIDVVPLCGTTSPLKPWVVHAHLRERSSNSLASFVEALGVTLQTLTEVQREKLFNGLTSFYQERAKKIVGGANAQTMDMEEAITTAGYVLKQLSKYFPLVVIIEDIHVLKGEMSFYALRHLQAIMERVPVLTMFVSRPSEEKYLKQFQEMSLKEGCEKYEVKNLKYEDVERLVETHRMRLPGEDAKKLMHLSGGNALLLRELLRSGTFDSSDSSASTTEQIIHYLTKELEQLPKRDRQAIAIAGMLGEEFSEQLLQEITKSKDFQCWSDDVLKRLEKKGIIGRRKKILKPGGEEKEVSLRVSVFSHALWWEAARKLYHGEKTWTDRKFAETIVPLLSHQDYPLLTDAELIVKLFQWLPRKMSFALLKYVDPLCSIGARWHFHTEKEMVEILAKARKRIVDLMVRTKSPFTKDEVEMMVRLLDSEKAITEIKEQTVHIANENYALIRKLLSQFLDSDRAIFDDTLSVICDECYKLFYDYADEHILKLAKDALTSLRPLAVRHNLEEHHRAFLSGVQACQEWYRNPPKATKLFSRGIQIFPWTGGVAYNFAGLFVVGIAHLPFPQSMATEYLLLATRFRKEATKADVPTLGMAVPILAYRAEISLALRAGKIADARERCEELLALKEKVWETSLLLKIQFIVAGVCSAEGDRDKALRIIQEIFSKFSWRDDTSCLKALSKVFLTIEEWAHFEKLWQENKHHLWPREMSLVVPLLEARLLMCSLLGNDEGVHEVCGMLATLRKNYPMLKECIQSSEKKTNLFLALKMSSLKQAKKDFEKFIDGDDTVGPSDKAFYLQLFARIGVKYGHNPKEFRSYALQSIKGFEKLGLEKRVIFIAQKLCEAHLLSKSELERLRKKYKVEVKLNQDELLSAQEVAKDERKTIAAETGITFRCLGPKITAYSPSGRQIIHNKMWGRQMPGTSGPKKIILELIRAKLESRMLKRKELLAAVFSHKKGTAISEKKIAKQGRVLSVYLSWVRKVFDPYLVFEKDGEEYRLHPSVKVDLIDIKEMLKKANSLVPVHVPSAQWLAAKAITLLEKGKGERGDYFVHIRPLGTEIHNREKESETLLRKLEKQAVL